MGFFYFLKGTQQRHNRQWIKLRQKNKGQVLFEK